MSNSSRANFNVTLAPAFSKILVNSCFQCLSCMLIMHNESLHVELFYLSLDCYHSLLALYTYIECWPISYYKFICLIKRHIELKKLQIVGLTFRTCGSSAVSTALSWSLCQRISYEFIKLFKAQPFRTESRKQQQLQSYTLIIFSMFVSPLGFTWFQVCGFHFVTLQTHSWKCKNYACSPVCVRL